MADAQPTLTPLSYSTDNELLNEIARRFPHGVLLVEREALKEPNAICHRWRVWGNSTWALGACQVLTQVAATNVIARGGEPEFDEFGHGLGGGE